MEFDGQRNQWPDFTRTRSPERDGFAPRLLARPAPVRCGNPDAGIMCKSKQKTPLRLHNLLSDGILQQCGRVAQLVEQCPFKAWVAGSNPAALTKPFLAGHHTSTKNWPVAGRAASGLCFFEHDTDFTNLPATGERKVTTFNTTFNSALKPST